MTPNEDHVRVLYDSLLPGNPYTMKAEDDDCCEHGIPFDEECPECEEDDAYEDDEEE